MVQIKRISIRGKYFIEQRDSKGRVISRTRWNQTNNIEKARREAKKTGSIRKDTAITPFVNVNEVVIRDGRKPRAGKYQAWVRIKGKGVDITARSMQRDYTYPLRKAKSEARESAFERLADHFNLDYDAEVGKDQFEKNNLKMFEGVVYYRRK